MRFSIFLAATGLFASAAAAQTPDAAPMTAQQAIARLSFMQGEWVGEASGMERDGTPYTVTQTERIGPLLGGDIMVVEGHGYRPDRSTGFNAFGVVSWNAQTSAYEFRSYAQGYSGTFPFTALNNGYVWETPAGPGVMRYTADITATTYHEVGELVMPGQAGRKMFEMTLRRKGDTSWPAAGAVDPGF